jgi:hypothetical protein
LQNPYYEPEPVGFPIRRIQASIFSQIGGKHMIKRVARREQSGSRTSAREGHANWFNRLPDELVASGDYLADQMNGPSVRLKRISRIKALEGKGLADKERPGKE